MYKKYIRINRFELKNRKNLEMKEAKCKKKHVASFFMPFFEKTGLNSYIVSKNYGVSEFWLQKGRQNILFEREEIRYCEIVPKRVRVKGEQHE